jgi:hypothetical protein
MQNMEWATRRAFLTGSGMVIAGIAGCTGNEERDPKTETAGPTESPEGTDVSETDRMGEDLDLREANVIDVGIEPDDDGTVRFDVTLFHDDAGEDGYANWWQVETMDRTRLGRRELLHAHGTEPFTRTTTIDVPSQVTCVVIRGHDQTHKYGGQVLLVNVETGNSRTVRQGPEAKQFAELDCP